MMKKQGSILLFSLLLLSALIGIAQQLYKDIYVGTRFNATMINREKAEVLALSGIPVAMALLNEHTILKKADLAKASRQEAEQKNKVQGQMANLLPLLNQWKTFTLTDALDGIDGELSLCITCEEGKIPLSQIYDSNAKTILAPFDALLKKITPPKVDPLKPIKGFVKKKKGGIEKSKTITDNLIDFFTEKNKHLDDLSELLAIDAFALNPLWYEPLKEASTKPLKKGEKPVAPIALYDLFSVYNSTKKVHPLLLSDGVKALLEVGRVEPTPFEKRKEMAKVISEKYKEQWEQDWVENWKNIQLLHPHLPKTLQSFKDIFASKFEPVTFSVISSAVVQGIEQRLCAVITRDTTYTDTVPQEKVVQKNKTSDIKRRPEKRPFKVLKIYWI